MKIIVHGQPSVIELEALRDAERSEEFGVDFRVWFFGDFANY